MASAQATARAYLDRNPVVLNQPFTLSVEVTGAQRLDAPPGVPPISQYARFVRSASSTSIQMVNGATTASVTYQFTFVATRTGAYQVPSLEVRANGQTLRTAPFSVSVTDKPTDGTPGELAPGVPRGAILLIAEASRRRVFPNQPITVEYRLFTQVDVTSYSVTSSPSTEGFWAEEVPMPDGPTVEQILRDGVQYTSAVLRRVTLFPTSPGTRTLDPMVIELQARIRRRGGSVFDNVFGGGLFDSTVPLVISSQAIQIDVQPLPPGKTDAFTGIVGSLDVRASLDRSNVDANQAATVTVEVSGQGNLRTLAPPRIELPPDFEVFEPEVTDDLALEGGTLRGTKSYRWVVIPRAPGHREIPPVRLEYLDPSSGRYETAASEPLMLEVGGEPPLTGTGVRAGVETLREDIRFIRLGDPELRPVRRPLRERPTFWIVAFLPLLASGGALALRRHQDRLVGDVAWARDRKAHRVARRRLRQARSLAQGGDVKAFYAEVGQVLQGFLADKLNLPVAGLMTREATQELRRRGVKYEVAQEVVSCMEHCDRQRFAPTPDAAEERSGFLQRVEGAMSLLHQELRR
jgi:hypothetical protein